MPPPPTEGEKDMNDKSKNNKKTDGGKEDSSVKEEEKQLKICDFNNFKMTETFKEYTTTTGNESRAYMRAPNPTRDKLLETVAILDNGELQYTTYPTYDGCVTMEPVCETQRETILMCAEKILRKEQGIDNEMALFISKTFSISYPEEKTKAKLATVIGDSLYVFDWIIARDQWTNVKQQILTWIPINLKSPQADKHSRKWMIRKRWQDYSRAEKETFRMNRLSLQISHFWIALGKKSNDKISMQYKIMKDSFVNIVPSILRRVNPDINTNRWDVATQLRCETTEKIEDVQTEMLNSLDKKPSRYDNNQISTSLFQRMIGNKYIGPIKEREREMVLSPSITNEDVRKGILDCHSYAIKTSLSEDYKNELKKVFKILSNTFEANSEITEILEGISVATKSYHLIGYLSNADMWFRYGYKRKQGTLKSKAIKPRWKPLSYKFGTKNNPGKTPMLTDIDTEKIEELCKDITGHSSNSINPRYMAIGIKYGAGYRIIKGQIYDILTYSQIDNIDILKETDHEKEHQEIRMLQELFEISNVKSAETTNQNASNEGNNKIYLSQWEADDKEERKSNKDSTNDNVQTANKNEESTTNNVQENSVSNDQQTDDNVTIKNNENEHIYKQIELSEEMIENAQNTIELDNSYEQNTNMITANNESIISVSETQQIEGYEEELESEREPDESQEQSQDNMQREIITSDSLFFTINIIRAQSIAPEAYGVPRVREIVVRRTKSSNEPKLINKFTLANNKQNDNNQEIEHIKIKPKNGGKVIEIDLRQKKAEKPKNNKDNKKVGQNEKFQKKKVNENSQMNNRNNVNKSKTIEKRLEEKTKILNQVSNSNENRKKQIEKNVEKKKQAEQPKKTNENEKQLSNDIIADVLENERKRQQMTITKTIIPKRITKKMMEKLIKNMIGTSSSPKAKTKYWLNIGKTLEIKSTQFLKTAQKQLPESIKTQRVQRSFEKGNIGKAFEFLIEGETDQVIPKEEELNVLFPDDKSYNFEPREKSPPFMVKDEHIDNSLKTLKNGKGVGWSGLSSEHIKQLITDDRLRDMLKSTVQGIINSPEQAPNKLYTSRLICIKKKPKGIRPICVEEILIKIVNKIVNTSITPHILENIDEAQTCLNGSNAQMNAVEKLKSHIECKDKNKYLTQIDMTNAFGRVRHKIIIKELRKIKEIRRLADYIEVFLKRARIKYEDENGKIKKRKIIRGVPQGDPLSMGLFALALNRVIRKMKKEISEDIEYDIVAYADDIILITDSKESMQTLMEIFIKEANKIGLIMNEEKTKRYKTRGQDDDEYISLDSTAMEYLGIPLSNDNNKIIEFVKEFLETIYTCADKLWNCKNLSIQARYHIYQVCILSKVIYMFRGVDVGNNILSFSNKLETLYDDIFKLPKDIMRLPVTLGGMGLLYLDDIRQISRLSYLVECGKMEIPPSLKKYMTENIKNEDGEMQHKITKAYFKKKREHYISQNQTADTQLLLMLDDRQTQTAHTLIVSPPTNKTQAMDDITFRLFVALRYHMDITKNSGLRCEKCNEDATLWHLLRCRIEQMKVLIWTHNKIKRIIGSAIKRNKNVTNVDYERPGSNSGKTNHIPDIVVALIDGSEHLLDITIENKFTQEKKCGYEPTNGEELKKRQYKGSEEEIYPIVFDNSGRVNNKSLEYLKTMGVTKGIIKYIQTVIVKSNEYALQNISEKIISANEEKLKIQGIQLDETVVAENL